MAYPKGRRSPNFKDLVGKRFGRLTVVERVGSSPEGQTIWSCRCDCGKFATAKGGNLSHGHTKSCGCLARDRAKEIHTKHGKCPRSGSTAEYALWKHAKKRAREQHVPFDLEVADITIPKTCPIMGTKLAVNTGKPRGNSPSLDKFEPEKGYVKGNVWVISYRANAFKSDFTVAQLKSFVAAIERGPGCDRDVNAARNVLLAGAGAAHKRRLRHVA